MDAAIHAEKVLVQSQAEEERPSPPCLWLQGGGLGVKPWPSCERKSRGPASLRCVHAKLRLIRVPQHQENAFSAGILPCPQKFHCQWW